MGILEAEGGHVSRLLGRTASNWSLPPVQCACNTIHAPADGDDGKGGHGRDFTNAVLLNMAMVVAMMMMAVEIKC